MRNETAPERIWLQGCDEEGCAEPFEAHFEVSWCAEQIHSDDVEYARADFLARLMAENELQKGALEDLETLIVVCNTIDQTAKKVMINLIRAALKGEPK